MEFKKVLKEAIANNTKIIITGRSGWGKSEMIQQVAKEEGYELVDFRLSEVLPEDLVGIPKVRDDFYEYVPPKWLYEIVQHPEKKYLLFLDEITQGTPEVLNICYKIFDKETRVGNYTLPNVAVVGATNYQDESNYLSELPEPLKKRACMIELDHNPEIPAKYLTDKYSLPRQLIGQTLTRLIKDYNPRAVEKAINLIQANCSTFLIAPYVGLDGCKSLKAAIQFKQKEEMSALDNAIYDLNQGFSDIAGVKCKITDMEQLKKLYNLTDEEEEVLNKNYQEQLQICKQANSGEVRNAFYTMYAINNLDITSKELNEIMDEPSFRPTEYIKKIKLYTNVISNQEEALLVMTGSSNLKELFRVMIQYRTFPIQLMKDFRADMPWDTLRDHARKGYLTDNKLKEFAKELGL